MSKKTELKQTEDQSKEMQAAMKIFNELGQRDAFPCNQLRNYITDNDIFAGYSFELGNPWYTGRYLSSITNLNVTINEYEVNPDYLSIIIRDQEIPVRVAKTMRELWWGFGEIATMLIRKEGLAENVIKASNDIRVVMNMQSPGGQPVNYVLQNEMEVVQ